MQYIRAYTTGGVSSLMPKPILAATNPPENYSNALPGQTWVNTTTGEISVFGGVIDGSPVWTAISGGEFDFTSITVSDGPNEINGELNINTDINQDVFINAGTSSGNVSIVSGTGTGEVTIGNLNAGDIDITSGGEVIIASVGDLSIGSQSNNIGIVAGGTTSIGSDADAGNVTIVGNPGTGDIRIGNSVAGNIDLESGGYFAALSDGAITISSTNNNVSISSASGLVSIEASSSINLSGLTATDINIGTAAGSKDIVVGSTDGLSKVSISGFEATSDAGTSANATVNANANIIRCVISNLNTASSGTGTITVNNTAIQSDSSVNVSFAISGGEDATMTIRKIRTTASTMTVSYTNNGADAIASDVNMFVQVLS